MNNLLGPLLAWGGGYLLGICLCAGGLTLAKQRGYDLADDALMILALVWPFTVGVLLLTLPVRLGVRGARLVDAQLKRRRADRTAARTRQARRRLMHTDD